MKILVTGASGFVGLNILEKLLADGCEVGAVANTPLPERARRAFAALPGRLHDFRADVRDEEMLAGIFRSFDPQRCIAGAAITPGPSREAQSFDPLIDVNIHGAVRLVRLAYEARCERVIFLSSASVYGAAPGHQGWLDEDASPPSPSAAYGIAKLAAEQLCLRFGMIEDFDVRAARIGTVFGPWEADTGVRETMSPIYQLMTLANRGEEIRLPRPGRRDFIYGPDVATAISLLLAAKELSFRVYNIGLGDEWAVEDWCVRLAEKGLGAWRRAGADEEPNVNLHSSEDRAPLSVTRLVDDVGFRPAYGMDEAFEHYLAWSSSERAGTR